MNKKKVPTPRTKFWRSPENAALGFAQIEYEDFSFEPHFHEHFVFMLLEKGVNLGHCQREKYEVVPGELLVLQPGELHTGCSFENQMLRYRAFYPNPTELKNVLEKMEISTAQLPDFQLKYRNPVLGAAFLNLAKSVEKGAENSLATDAAMFDFFEKLLLQQHETALKLSKNTAGAQIFERARDFIESNFSENFSLNQLAQAAGANPFHLIRVFKRHSGLTPFEYLRSLRVERAKQWMRHPVSLTEVAYHAGFFDQSHFIRSFKSCTGFLPSEFRGGLA